MLENTIKMNPIPLTCPVLFEDGRSIGFMIAFVAFFVNVDLGDLLSYLFDDSFHTNQ